MGRARPVRPPCARAAGRPVPGPRVDRARRGRVRGGARRGSVLVEQSGRRVLVGMRHAFWPDLPTLDVLDEATGEVPTYIVNADLHSIWMNSAAFRREQIAPDPSGLVSEHAAFDVANTLNDVDAADADAALERAAARSAARGLVAFSDLEMGGRPTRGGAAGRPDGTCCAWRAPCTPSTSTASSPRGSRRAIGSTSRASSRIGALKLVGDGSAARDAHGRVRTAPPSDSERGGRNPQLRAGPPRRARSPGRQAQVSLRRCTRSATSRSATALDGFAHRGGAGSIEHAQLVAATDIARFARLGIEASVQPHSRR